LRKWKLVIGATTTMKGVTKVNPQAIKHRFLLLSKERNPSRDTLLEL
jgi:hypothetical protein